MNLVKKEVVFKMNGDNVGQNQIMESLPKEGDNYYRPVAQQVRNLRTITGSLSLNYINPSCDPLLTSFTTNVGQYHPLSQTKPITFPIQFQSIQNNSQKMLISKTQLIQFAQCFAHQKLQLQKTISYLTTKLAVSSEQVIKLRQQKNELIKVGKTTVITYQQQNQSQQSQSQSLSSLLSSSSSLQLQLTEQIHKLKCKLKQQFQKRITAEKQFHNQKAICFQLNKKIQFLTQKINYQEEQVIRCQNLLKIKQDIIQNFEWEKTIATTKIQNKNNNINNNNNKNIHNNNNNRNNNNYPVEHHRHQQQQQQLLYKSISKQRNKQVHNQENVSPLTTKKCLIKSSKKVPSNNQPNKIQNNNNQTVKLSEINLNMQNKNTQLNKQKNQLLSLDNEQIASSVKKINKHVISKVPEQVVHRDSKKKMNISLKKRSQNSSLNRTDLPTSKDASDIKPRSIVLKRHPTNQSQSMTVDESPFQTRQKQLQTYYIKIITQLQKQNSLLKSNALSSIKQKSSISQLINSNNINKAYQSSQLMLRSSTNNNFIDRKKSVDKHTDIQWKYNMMRQKSLLLQNQIQKTVENYLLLQQKHTSQEKIIQSLQNQLYQYTHRRFYPEQSYQSSQDPINRPSIEFNDLVTPQFRDSKWKSNFFPKNKEQNHNQILFQNISLQENMGHRRNPVLDTFEKQKPHTESCYIENKVSNNLFVSTEEKPSTALKSEMQQVSEIIYRNDEQEVLEQIY